MYEEFENNMDYYKQIKLDLNCWNTSIENEKLSRLEDPQKRIEKQYTQC